jgi:hypothetical protein
MSEGHEKVFEMAELLKTHGHKIPEFDKEIVDYLTNLMQRSGNYLLDLDNLKKEIRDITDAYIVAYNLTNDEKNLQGGSIRFHSREEIEMTIFQTPKNKKPSIWLTRQAIKISSNFIKTNIQFNTVVFDKFKAKDEFINDYQLKEVPSRTDYEMEYYVECEIRRNELQTFLARLDKCRWVEC